MFNSVYLVEEFKRGVSGMNPESQSLSRSAFAVFCAFALAASMALPFVGVSKSYAEEVGSSAAEGTRVAPTQTEGIAANTSEANMITVEFCGTAVSAQVEKGQTIDPTVLAKAEAEAKLVKTGTTPDGMKADAVFVGWLYGGSYAQANGMDADFCQWDFSNYDNPLDDPGVSSYHYNWLTSSTAVASNQYESNVMKIWAVYAMPVYYCEIGIYGTDSEVGFSVSPRFGIPANHNYRITDSSTYDAEMKRILNYGSPVGSLKGYYAHPKWSRDEIPNFTVPYDMTKSVDRNVTVWEVYSTDEPSPNTPPVVSGSTGITVNGTLSGPNVPEGSTIQLDAAAVSSGDAYDELAARVSSALAGVFEVNLTVDGKPVHEGFGTIEVTFPVDEKYNGHWITVWHRHTDGTITSDKVVAKDGKVTVAITDLSTFALEVGELAKEATSSGDTKTPEQVSLNTSNASTLAQTGDATPILAFGGFALVALGASAFASYRARKSAHK